MTHTGLFSGIGGFEEAFRCAGATLSVVCEIDPKAQSVLRRHFPEAEIISDVKTITKKRYAIQPDIITGGFPCQDLSVAGRRAGLDGERSGLWFEYLRIITEYQPRWVVIENVPGLLSGCGCFSCQAVGRLIRIHSRIRRRKGGATCDVCVAGKRMLESHSGRNLTIILSGLVKRGYGVAWRILDAQYFGLAQRRERVFIVASLRSGGAAKVLFERESGTWDSPPRREAGERVASTIRSGTAMRSAGAGQTSNGMPSNLVGFGLIGNGEYANRPATIRSKGGDCGGGSEHLIAHTLRAEGFDASEDGTGRGTPLIVAPELSIPLTASGRGTERTGENRGQDTLITAFRDERGRGSGGNAIENVTYPLHCAKGQSEQQIVASLFGVRRLMPIECERLQGFEDRWTAFDDQGKEISDSARYRMLGNAVAVPVVEWIARRIMKADAE